MDLIEAEQLLKYSWENADNKIVHKKTKISHPHSFFLCLRGLMHVNSLSAR